MISLQYDPYKDFATSTTPVGLYARQKWLGQEQDEAWQDAFDRCVASLLECQLNDGSWGGSFIQTVSRLFGLHLTARHPTKDIGKALDWLLKQTEHIDVCGGPALTGDNLNGLPFVPGDPHVLYTAMMLFMCTIFGRSDTPEIMTRYQKLSRYILQDSNGSDHGDTGNVLRAFAVHPLYAQSSATMHMVESLSKIQDNSGIWADEVPFYLMVNALAHLNLPLADRQLEKAFSLLVQTQNEDGTWGDIERERNTFLVVHAMKNKKMLI